MQASTTEIHFMRTSLTISGRELHKMIVDALKRRGIDTDGAVLLAYEHLGSRASSSEISAGPDLYVTIERRLKPIVEQPLKVKK